MLLAGAGGFVGTCGRFLVGRCCSALWNGAFPLGTLLVNLIGCFLIGLLYGLVEKTDLMTSTESALLITGFCGGFTTFSAFADDMWQLTSKGEWPTLLLYLSASILLGFLLVIAGRALIR